VIVRDKDSGLSGKFCQSVNDPHMRSFDGRYYEMQLEGAFWLYRHKSLPIEVRMVFFVNQPLSVRGWTSAFLLDIHRLCGIIEGRLSHFLPRWLRRIWRSVISQAKSLEIFCHGRELNPCHREDRQWAIPLSYHDWRNVLSQINSSFLWVIPHYL